LGLLYFGASLLWRVFTSVKERRGVTQPVGVVVADEMTAAVGQIAGP
jgi:hypothetical protein